MFVRFTTCYSTWFYNVLHGFTIYFWNGDPSCKWPWNWTPLAEYKSAVRPMSLWRLLWFQAARRDVLLKYMHTGCSLEMGLWAAREQPLDLPTEKMLLFQNLWLYKPESFDCDQLMLVPLEQKNIIDLHWVVSPVNGCCKLHYIIRKRVKLSDFRASVPSEGARWSAGRESVFVQRRNHKRMNHKTSWNKVSWSEGKLFWNWDVLPRIIAACVGGCVFGYVVLSS